jgi:flagellar motor switch protein FliN/FliY
MTMSDDSVDQPGTGAIPAADDGVAAGDAKAAAETQPEPDGLSLATFADLGDTPQAPSPDADLSLVLDVPVDLVVEIGRARMSIRETLAIGKGSMITLDKVAGEPADLLVNGRLIARGEVVAIDEEFGFRVTDVVTPDRR